MADQRMEENPPQQGDVAQQQQQEHPPEMHYRTYLHLDQLYSLQNPVSNIHDEYLFIITHQSFELWFKAFIYEMDCLRELFRSENPFQLTKCVSLLNRIKIIMEHLLHTFKILRTMDPMNFREFRDKLFPASGFQSHLFRVIENKLGVRPDDRVPYNKDNYRAVFKKHPDIIQQFDQTESESSLAKEIEGWLERLYDSDVKFSDNFWLNYTTAVGNYIQNLPSEEEKEKKREFYSPLLQEKIHQDYVVQGNRRFSWKALKAGMLLNFYKDDQRFGLAYSVLSLLTEIDALFAKWRMEHMLIVQQSIGAQPGTGGSSGYLYLRSTMRDSLKVFLDLSNLCSYLLPRSHLGIQN